MSYRLTSVFCICVLIASCSGSEPKVSNRMVDIGTHRLHARLTGKESPAVVIDVGIGSRSEEWHPLQDRISEQTLVVTYDRAGYGRSEPGPLPRDSGREADELRALLEGAAVKGPYILVGHSLGALNMQVYAARYPEDVVAIVLLDPPPLGWLLGESYQDLIAIAEQMTGEWQAIADRGSESSDPGERAEAAFFLTIASEHREMLGKSTQFAAKIETFGDVPLIVIASGVANPMFGEVAEEYQQYWAEQSRALAAKSTRGEFVLAEGSSHQLHVDAADLVVARILTVIAEVRERE